MVSLKSQIFRIVDLGILTSWNRLSATAIHYTVRSSLHQYLGLKRYYLGIGTTIIASLSDCRLY